MRIRSRWALVVLGLMACAVWLAPPTGVATAGDDGKGGAFLGGLIGGAVISRAASRSERRTRAAEQQSYQSQQQQPTVVYQQAPQQSAGSGSDRSVEQRLQQLDDLAANGYISPEEYQRRRTAILDSL